MGEGHGQAVSDRYEAQFAFTGTLHEVVIQLGLRSKDQTATEAQAEMSRQ